MYDLWATFNELWAASGIVAHIFWPLGAPFSSDWAYDATDSLPKRPFVDCPSCNGPQAPSAYDALCPS